MAYHINADPMTHVTKKHQIDKPISGRSFVQQVTQNSHDLKNQPCTAKIILLFDNVIVIYSKKIDNAFLTFTIKKIMI